MRCKNKILFFGLWLLLTIVWLCSLVEITTLVSYHNPFTAGELFAWFTANGHETNDIVCYCLRYVSPYWVVCSLIYVGCCWLLWRAVSSTKHWAKGMACLVTSGLLLPFCAPFVPHNLLGEIMCVVNQINALREHDNDNVMFSYHATRTDTTSQKEVYVLSVGESLCYRNISLNGGYQRETTPLLAHQDDLCLYSDYYATATLTQHALPMLFCGVDAEHFFAHYARKTMAAAFHEAGFQTALISHRAQLMNNRYHNYLTRDFDTVLMVEHDSLIASRLEMLCSKSNKLFVVTHYLGNHLFYTNRADTDLIWRPDYNADHRAKSDSLFLNAYDNSIRYTDRMLNSEIDVLKSQDCLSVWLFVSDHGEYIGSQVSGHGYTYCPTIEEYHVPLMAWTSKAYQTQHPDRVTNMVKHKDEPVCADYVFQSVLDMAGVNIKDRTDKSVFLADMPVCRRLLLLPDGQTTMQL